MYLIFCTSTISVFNLQDDLSGQTLLDVVFARLNLIETAYFGLRYLDDENQTVRCTSYLTTNTKHATHTRRQINSSTIYHTKFNNVF